MAASVDNSLPYLSTVWGGVIFIPPFLIAEDNFVSYVR